MSRQRARSPLLLRAALRVHAGFVIDAAMYEAIGRVTVAAAGMESMLAHTVCVFLDEDEDAYARMLGTTGGAWRAWTTARSGIGETIGDPRRVTQLSDGIEHLLGLRHRVAHSVAMHDLDTDEQKWWHPRTDTLEAWDLGRVREVARDLGTGTDRLVALGHEIAALRKP